MKALVGLGGLALAAYMVSLGWVFWPVIIALVSLCVATDRSL